MRFNDLLHLVAFPWKAHGTPPTPGFVTATKMPESRALSKFSDHFSRYIPLSAPAEGPAGTGTERPVWRHLPLPERKPLQRCPPLAPEPLLSPGTPPPDSLRTRPRQTNPCPAGVVFLPGPPPPGHTFQPERAGHKKTQTRTSSKCHWDYGPDPSTGTGIIAKQEKKCPTNGKAG